jgi:hypothetical protein
MTGVRVHLADRVEDLFALAGVEPLLSDQWLCELTRLDRMRRRGERFDYLVAADGVGDALGVLALYPAGAPSSAFDTGTGAGTSGLLCGGFGNLPNVFAALPDRPDVVAALLSSARAIAAARGLSFLSFPHLDDQRLAALRPHLPADAQAIVTHEGVLELGFDSFADYLAALPHDRRHRVRRELRHFAESGVEVREVSLGASVTELTPLLGQVFAKYGNPQPADELRLYLESIAAAMGEYGTTLAAVHGGRVLAFRVLWAEDGQWRGRCWGCDYENPLLRNGMVYFNLVFYQTILRAIGRTARLVFGTGSMQAKVYRGAWARPLTTLVSSVAPR